MILMALDDGRDYFGLPGGPPTSRTPPLFTR